MMTRTEPKILLVDDREDNLLSLEVILEEGGYKFVKANSGREALKILLNDVDFAMILMDVNMPKLNGFETASLIYGREKLKHVPIIFITANNYEDTNIFKGYQVGAIDFILKPIKPEVLRAKVGLLIDLYNKNRQLLEQEQKLIRTNRDLERFAYMVSHDLQEPLRKIRMFSGILSEKYRDVLPEEGSMITRINKAAERMQTLVSSILALSKASNEKIVFEKCDMNVLLAEMVVNMNEEMKENRVTILVESIPLLFVSPGLMRQLFQNLVNNAIKYRRKDVDTVIEICAESSLVTSNGNPKIVLNKNCLLFVKDNGIGFNQKYSEDIFNMLKKLHSSSEYEGSGIGLTLCRRIADLHNGFISARSKENEGSTFTVSLPLFQEQAA